MDDPIFNSNNIVGGSSANYTFSAMSREIHSNQSFILIQTFTEADGGGPFDISAATSTLFVSAYKNSSLDRFALTSGVLSDSGGGTIDTVTFTVPKDLIPTTLGTFPQRNGGNSVFFYILEDVDSVLEFGQGVNVVDPSYGLTGEVDPGASTITTQRNDLGTVEDTVIVDPPIQSFELAYIVGPVGATGDWVGQENNLAVSNGSSWIFTLPEEGNFVYDKNLGAQKTFGTSWEVSADGDMLASSYDPQLIIADSFDRSNMTGTQDHTTISDYDTELAGTTNATTFTPTADYHPATKKYVDDATPALTFNDLTDVTLTTVTQGDILYYNGTVWVNLGPGVNGQFLKTQGAAANPAWESIAGGGDMLESTYDAAAVAEQLVGLTATQSLTNKTVNNVILTTLGSSANFLNEAGSYVAVTGGFPSGRVSPTVTATTDIDWTLGDSFDLGTLAVDVTLTFSGLVQGQTIQIEYTNTAAFDLIALPATVTVLNGGSSTQESNNTIYITATNGITEQQAAYSTDAAAGDLEGVKTEPGTTYTLTDADSGFLIYFTNVAGCTVSLNNGLATGFFVSLIQDTATTVLTLAGTASLKAGSDLLTAVNNDIMVILPRPTPDEYVVKV